MTRTVVSPNYALERSVRGFARSAAGAGDIVAPAAHSFALPRLAQRGRQAPSGIGFTMSIGQMLIVPVALSALAACATHYHEASESEPHATLTFQRHGVFSLQLSVFPVYFNEATPPSGLIARRQTFNIHAGTMRVRVAEHYVDSRFTSGSRYPCFFSFEAEAGKSYFISVVETDNAYLYAVTADTAVKVAECKALPLW